MAFKQPRIPEYREDDGTARFLHALVLFLKDFCQEAWTANQQRERELRALREEMQRLRTTGGGQGNGG